MRCLCHFGHAFHRFALPAVPGRFFSPPVTNGHMALDSLQLGTLYPKLKITCPAGIKKFCCSLHSECRTKPIVWLHNITAVGWGTALQGWRSRVRFPMVSLELFIGIILPAVLWFWGRLSLQQKWVPGTSPGGVKAAGKSGLQSYQLHVPTVLRSGSLNLLEPSRPVQACKWIALTFWRRTFCFKF